MFELETSEQFVIIIDVTSLEIVNSVGICTYSISLMRNEDMLLELSRDDDLERKRWRFKTPFHALLSYCSYSNAVVLCPYSMHKLMLEPRVVCESYGAVSGQRVKNHSIN